jgi:hypothetical protein
MATNRRTVVTVVKSFCKWGSILDPSIVLAPDFFSQEISPSGSKVGDAEWEFPADWIVRGTRSNRVISFEQFALKGHTPQSVEYMARQYAVLLLTSNNTIRSLATFQNRVHLNNRLIAACLEKVHGLRSLSNLSHEELSLACRSLQTDWTKGNSDRALLRKVIEEVANYYNRELLSDNYTKFDCSARLTVAPFTQRQNLDAIRRTQPKLPKSDKTPDSTLPFPVEWVDTLLPIARFYINVLSPHVTRHLAEFKRLRAIVGREKHDRVKKVIGRNIAKAYAKFAAQEIEEVKWVDQEGTILQDLEFETNGSFAFPPRNVDDLHALVASLQICCFQIIALQSAARAAEMHTVSTQGISQSGDDDPVFAIHGSIFKGTGSVGFRDHKWIVSQQAVKAVEVQDKLFAGIRSEGYFWCQTKQGSLGKPLNKSEQMHLIKFVDRHNLSALLEGGQISIRRFRKTWAEMAMIAGLTADEIRQQLGHAPSEGGITDQTAGYMFSDQDASLRFQVAQPQTSSLSSSIKSFLKETIKP